MARLLSSSLLLLIAAGRGLVAAEPGVSAPALLGIPVEFVLFAATLLAVALFHRHTLAIGLAGLAAITAFKLGFATFPDHHGGGHRAGFAGLGRHLADEWVTLANLLGLLLGFDLLAHHFSSSRLPALIPRFLPGGRWGAFTLLALVFVLSGFLDNIAAAMIGGTVAATVFKGKVHIGYLVGIVAAANAGGAGSVVGDTTTTMMWIAGIAPGDVFHAYLAAAVAMLVGGVVAADQQHRHHPLMADADPTLRIDGVRVAIVVVILASAIAANLIINLRFAAYAERLPWLGLAVWTAILLTAALRRPHWAGLPAAARGAVFLLSLVLAASMMPVASLPAASWRTAFGLGLVSAVFDNIPLTALALKQGGYDWGVLAYCVGFGGSLLWFGSSAGVALANIFTPAKSVGSWLRHGWHAILAYVIGFSVMLLVLGWHPHAPRQPATAAPGAGHPTPEAAAAAAFR